MSKATEVLAHVSTYTDDGEEFSNVQSEYLNELVNSHDALVAALEDMCEIVKSISLLHPAITTPSDFDKMHNAAAALAKAKGTA